jgi:nucleotide-binding universal stress UspA family protein
LKVKKSKNPQRRKEMIPQIKKILYATDLSKNSVYAFPFAVDLARIHNGSIVILHAVEPTPAVARGYVDLRTDQKSDETVQERVAEYIRKRIDNSCKALEKLIGAPCTSLISKVVVPVGHPIEEILVTADEEDCDIIIMGTHGKGFLKHSFLGSVARSVLDRSRKPVMIVPLPSEKVTIDWWQEA